MKTYEEACDAVMLRKLKTEGESVADMYDSVEKYASLHREIQNSQHARMLAEVLLEGPLGDFGPIILLCVAFSHGVMIGIEMTKQDLPEGMLGGQRRTQQAEYRAPL